MIGLSNYYSLKAGKHKVLKISLVFSKNLLGTMVSTSEQALLSDTETETEVRVVHGHMVSISGNQDWILGNWAAEIRAYNHFFICHPIL